MRPLILLALLGAAAGTVHADEAPVLLKFASVAPENSAWAQALHSFGREVESATHGQVRIKWYLGGIAGDDLQAGQRIRAGQLDGVASGGMFCSRLSPTLRALRLLTTERDESSYATSRLKPVIDDEFQHQGFVNLGVTGLGPDVLFTRTPARSLDDLQHGRYWIWDLDEDLGAMLTEMGVHVVPLPLEKARRAFDPLPLETQKILRSATGKLRSAFENIGRAQDQALVDGLFARQGLKRLPVKESAQSELLAAARAARQRLGAKLVPSKMFDQVRAVLEERNAGGGAGEPGR
jgi:TRAP-type C4-dicarboxylate transport system substrate-binding protein